MASKKTEEQLSPAYFFERRNVMCKKKLFLISTVLLLSLVGNTWAQGCDYIRVSQESSPGANDFDNNILGYIKTFQTTDTAADYYSYSSPYPASFSNLGFIGQHGLPPDRSHLFLVAGNDGLSLFIVHDRPEGLDSPDPPLDQDGGKAEMRFDLSGVPGGAKRTVEDDPGESYYIPALNESATTFRSRTAWLPCCTDGEVITGLDGNWSMFVQFTEFDPTIEVIEGLNSWFADSADGSTIRLALEQDRRVRLDCEGYTTKWFQPPVTMNVYVGWDEESHNFLPRMVADDFLCDSNEPVSAIRWWGSFMDWKDSNVPDSNDLPDRFYLTIWDDVPYSPLIPPDPNDPNGQPGNPYSYPNDIVWENYCDSYYVNFHGWEYDPRSNQIEASKFEFYQELDPDDYWYQPDDDNIYWLGIMAIYDGNEPNNLWGWETRRHYFQDDAVRFFGYPDANQSYDANDFEPIEFGGDTWDMSFEIISIPNEPQQVPDLGDAPDSSNNFGATMTTYPWGVANFPTVYDDGSGSGPYGPIHLRPKAVAHLGTAVTFENEADKGWDQDPTNNIDPNINAADQDLADDGVSIPLNLPRCRWSTFDYTVNVFDPNINLYVNVWFDWNRNGDWDGIVDCWNFLVGLGWHVPEWAVRNQLLSNLSPGLNTITTPMFSCGGRDWEPIWMRITLSEQSWSSSAMASGGAGPVGGYKYGETEDYYFTPQGIWWASPDLNADGIVNFKDIAAVAADWLQVDPNYIDPNGS